MNKNIMKIVIYPNPLLRKKAKKIKEITPEIHELTKRMIQIMIKEDGVGLAAPQVGISKRMIIVQGEKGPEVFLNPRIIFKSKEKELAEEGCLSLPGLFLEVKRSRKVKVEFTDLEGERYVLSAEGIMARIFQHEIDHLNGILFIDRIPFWQKIKNFFNQRY